MKESLITVVESAIARILRWGDSLNHGAVGEIQAGVQYKSYHKGLGHESLLNDLFRFISPLQNVN
jgi:hypothetical protein